MAFDPGGAFGGALSGAATGSAFGPIGSVIGGIGGLLTGGIGASGPEPYQPTPLEQQLQKYAFNQTKATPQRKKTLLSQFKSFAKEGNRGGAEAFLEQYVNSFSNPQFIERKLSKSYSKPVDYTSPSYEAMAKSVFGQQGLGYTGDEYGGYIEQAKARNIRSPLAFADMLKQDLIASRKVPTGQQEILENIFGPAERDPATGKLTGRYGGASKPVTMPNIPAAINYNYA